MEKTIISWALHNYCKAQCDYCPIGARGGSEPRDVTEYLRIAQLLIDSYSTLQHRKIEWIFNGGEPLDLNYLPQFLKFCKQDNNHITLHTNGGKLWLDWWAIEPYIDNLNLTFHFWQNPSLVKYIADAFISKNKSISLTAPIRPDNVDLDLTTVDKLEKLIDKKIARSILYVNGDKNGGMLGYKVEDLIKIDQSNGIVTKKQSSVEEKIYFDDTTWTERHQKTYSENPSYTGYRCNAGIEKLHIEHNGWVSGSSCNNQHYSPAKPCCRSNHRRTIW